MNLVSPKLTVIVVTPVRCATLNRTLRFLQEQTIRDSIELILMAPRESSFDDLDPAAVSGFARCQKLAIGPIIEIERAFAAGVAVAAAPVVALLENHVYPNPGWGEAIVRAHEGPWNVVGCVITNANSATAASLVEHLLSYAFHDERSPVGEVEQISRNNTTFKRDALTVFGDRLPDMLARDGGLLMELKRGGTRFYREQNAQLAHLNPSLVGPVLRLRLNSARASSATRARTGAWSTGRKAAYVLASPLFPLLRIRALWSRLSSPPIRQELPRITPLLILALLVDACGQALGFALGAGASSLIAGKYDLDREPYLTAVDRATFME